MLLSLISVVLVLLVGELSVKFVLPLISVDLVPRVGGLGIHFFFWDVSNASDNSQGAKCSRVYGILFPLLPRTGGVNILLALGSEVVRRPWFLCLETVLDPVLHDL